MSDDALVLLANLGAEEGEAWRRSARHPEVARAAALWASLFGQEARVRTPDGDDGGPASPHAEPAFDWLPRGPGGLAWLSDAAAARELDPLEPCGAAPEVVARVHDKAFALQHGTTPGPLRGLARSFEPAELRDEGAAIAAIEATVADWPTSLRGAFCLKPRRGTSGRGRVRGSAEAVDVEALRGALPRLADRGGAILEPWLERTADLSASFHLGDGSAGPPLELLGSLEAVTSPAGVPRGHRGEIDRRGRIHCGGPHDDALRAAASELALEAWEAGLRGPCGVDGFAFRDEDGSESLRPTVELNARFTMGIVALGCLRRVRLELREALGILPETRASILVAWDDPGRPWSDFGLDVVWPIETVVSVPPDRGPAILGARDAAALDPIAAALAQSGRNGAGGTL